MNSKDSEKSSQKRKKFINSRKVHKIEKRRKTAQKSKQAGIQHKKMIVIKNRMKE